MFVLDGLGIKAALSYLACEGDNGLAFQHPLAFRSIRVSHLVHVAAVVMLNMSSGASIGLNGHPFDD